MTYDLNKMKLGTIDVTDGVGMNWKPNKVGFIQTPR